MKKTFNINIAGFPFTIDDDAYSLLNEYIATIEHAFSNQEDYAELTADIESRIAELLMDLTASGSPIVSLEEVEDVIRRIGKPEEMVEDDEKLTINTEVHPQPESLESMEGESNEPHSAETPNRIKKKLYRDTQNSMLGGVCSGLSWYVGIDVTWIRLLTIAAFIFSFSTCAIIYIVLWIVVPEARTPLQRMQMMGEQPTVENIGRNVTDSFREDRGERIHNEENVLTNRFSSSIATIIEIFVRVLAVVGLIIGIPVLIGLGIALIGCMFLLIMVTTSFFTEPTTIFGDVPVKMITHCALLGIGSIIVIGIPLFLLLRKGFKTSRNTITYGAKWTLLGVWIVGFILAAVSTFHMAKDVEQIENRHHHKIENMSRRQKLRSKRVYRDSPSITKTETDTANIKIEQKTENKPDTSGKNVKEKTTEKENQDSIQR